MHVTLDLPDEILEHPDRGGDVSRRVVEAFAVEAYRQRKLTHWQVIQLLQLDRWQTEELLARHNAQRPYDMADLEIDRRSFVGLDEE
jgi:predicted HTH domain antitoxin